MNKERTVKISVGGAQYFFKCNSDGYEQRIKDVANYVDAEYRKLAKSRPSAAHLDLLVLLSLNICDELFTEKLKHELQR